MAPPRTRHAAQASPLNPDRCPALVPRAPVAAYLNVSRNTLIRWERAGHFPRAVRIGLGTYVYRRWELLAALVCVIGPAAAEGGAMRRERRPAGLAALIEATRAWPDSPARRWPL